MKKIMGSLIPGITCFLFACSHTPSLEDAKKEDAERLQNVYIEITAMAAPVSCTKASDWKWMPIGAKACGGPTGYLPYHISVDEDYLKHRVNAYTDLQKAFNKKWGAASDCSIPFAPSGIQCENNKPVFTYSAPPGI